MANLSCSMSPPPLNNNWEYYTTFYYNNTIHLYGGIYTASTCISYSTNTEEWKTHTLSTPRKYGHSSTILNKVVYIIGGQDASNNYIGAESTPLPLTDRPVLTPVLNLDYKGTYQCTAKVDEDTLVVIGGYYNGYLSSVIEYKAKDHTTTALPSMKQPRYTHGCAVLEMDNTKWIIVAGGHNGYRYLETTEMLQMGENAWKPLGNLNVARRGHSIVVTQRGVMAMGGRGRIRGFRGHSLSESLSSVELLDWSGKSWRMVQPSLSKSRYYFGGAVEIPASMFDCRGTTTTSATIATTTSTITTTTDETTKTATTTTTALPTPTGAELGTCLNSPGFPVPYPNNSNWVQSLEVPPGQKILVTFLHFDIEKGNGPVSCPYDYVEFLDASGQPVGPKLCGDSLPQPITIESSTAKVIFRSDESVAEKGFKLCYSPTESTSKSTANTTSTPITTTSTTTTATTITSTTTTTSTIKAKFEDTTTKNTSIITTTTITTTAITTTTPTTSTTTTTPIETTTITPITTTTTITTITSTATTTTTTASSTSTTTTTTTTITIKAKATTITTTTTTMTTTSTVKFAITTTKNKSITTTSTTSTTTATTPTTAITTTTTIIITTRNTTPTTSTTTITTTATTTITPMTKTTTITKTTSTITTSTASTIATIITMTMTTKAITSTETTTTKLTTAITTTTTTTTKITTTTTITTTTPITTTTTATTKTTTTETTSTTSNTEEEGVATKQANLAGTWSTTFVHGVKATFSIKPDGEISLYGRKTVLEPSDDQVNFPSSEGWMKGDKLWRDASWSYYRVAQDGTLEVENFRTDGTPNPNNFQNLDHYCCSGIGHRVTAPATTTTLVPTPEFSTALLLSRDASTLLTDVGCSVGEEYEGNCYLLVETPKTWLDAQVDCNGRNGNLTSIDNIEANNFLANLAGGSTAWIGASDAETEGSWKWTNGDNVLFTNWYSGQPDNTHGIQHCGYINYGGSYGKWDDGSCGSMQLPFICQGNQLLNDTEDTTTTTPATTSTTINAIDTTTAATTPTTSTIINTIDDIIRTTTKTTTTSPIGPCPIGWTSLASGCYQIVKTDNTISYQEAMQNCKHEKGYLVEMNTQEEHEAIIQFFNDKKVDEHVWLGGTDEEKTGKWIGGHSGEEIMKFNGWSTSTGQPSHVGSQHCILTHPIRQFKWNDYWCDNDSQGYKPKAALCEYDTASTTTTMTTTTPTTDSVYFVAGGRDNQELYFDTELYSPTIENLQCSITLPEMDRSIRYWLGHYNFYYNNTIYSCGQDNTGGVSYLICMSYSRQMRDWETYKVTPGRRDVSGVILEDTLYLIGGSHEWPKPTSTKLPLSEQSVWNNVPNLNFQGSAQCVAKIDEESLVITGGINYGSRKVADVKQYNAKTSVETSLPPMSQHRFTHGCIVVERDNKKWLIVSGGHNDSMHLQSTEMLQLLRENSSWISLGNLNWKRAYLGMAETVRGVMVLGGNDKTESLKSVELLDWATKRWKVVHPSLKKGRNRFGGALKIPASMFNCQAAVDGEWSAWSKFTACSATCGNTTKTRNRACSNPSPSNGGKPCPGLDEEVVSCGLSPCGFNMSATCDDVMWLFADGDLLVNNSSDWRVTSEVHIPPCTKVIEIHCLDSWIHGGILASSDNGLITDGAWNCSSDNRTTWNPAYLLGRNGRTAPDISPEAIWIWTDMSHWMQTDHRRHTKAICKIELETSQCPEPPVCPPFGELTPTTISTPTPAPTTTTTLTTSKPKPGFNLTATCDNEMKLFVDGNLLATSSNWRDTSKVNIPANAEAIEIHCMDTGTVGGILASSDNGLLTDGAWNCSSDNGTTWNPAYEVGPNGGAVPDISPEAEWIWTGCIGDWTSKYTGKKYQKNIICKIDLKPVIDGGWSTWRPFSPCSATCADATKARTRTCSQPSPDNGGNPCLGLEEEVVSCGLSPCGEDSCPYTDKYMDCPKWKNHCESGQWGKCVKENCPKTCNCTDTNNATTTTRTSTIGGPQFGDWSPWNSWSPCSSTCGIAVKTRTRTCLELPCGPGITEETASCHLPSCGPYIQQKCFLEDSNITFLDLGHNHMNQDLKPVWKIGDKGRSLTETLNTRPSIGLSNLGDVTEPVSFSGRVFSASGDDDVIGMVFGFWNEANFFVIASARQHPGPTNWYVARLHATCGSSCAATTTISDAIWHPQSHPEDITVLATGSTYWQHGNQYNFTVSFNPSELLLSASVTNQNQQEPILETGIISAKTNDSGVDSVSRKGGFVGVYVDSQAQTTWDYLVCQDYNFIAQTPVKVDMCTGDFYENGRPPAGTKCVEKDNKMCYMESGRWGKSWCHTEVGDWGAECVKCSDTINATTTTRTSTIVVTGGSNRGGKLATSEVIGPEGVCSGGIPPLPVALELHASVFFNNQLMVCGGYTNTYQKKCYFLKDAASKSWVEGPSLNTPRAWFTLTKVGVEVFAVGGEGSSGDLDTIEKLSGNPAQWKILDKKMSTIRELHCTVYWEKNNSLVVIGGNYLVNIAQSFNLKTGVWSDLAQLPVLRELACSVFEDSIVVTGGWEHASKQDNLKIYVYKEGNWETIGEMDGPRRYHTMDVLDGKLLVIGGTGRDGIEQIRSNGTLETLNFSLSGIRQKHSAAKVPAVKFPCFH